MWKSLIYMTIWTTWSLCKCGKTIPSISSCRRNKSFEWNKFILPRLNDLYIWTTGNNRSLRDTRLRMCIGMRGEKRYLLVTVFILVFSFHFVVKNRGGIREIKEEWKRVEEMSRNGITPKMKIKNEKQLLVGFFPSRVFVTLYSPSFSLFPLTALLPPFFIHNFPYIIFLYL